MAYGQQRSCDSPLGQSDSECHRRSEAPYRYGSEAPTLFLTEGEKAAVYGTLLWPQHVWMATGGKQNLKADLLEPLRGYSIQALPDADALDVVEFDGSFFPFMPPTQLLYAATWRWLLEYIRGKNIFCA